MREVMIVLLLLILGSAQITQEKGTLFGNRITYVPFVLIGLLALLEIKMFEGLPIMSAMLLPFVLFIIWLTSISAKK